MLPIAKNLFKTMAKSATILKIKVTTTHVDVRKIGDTRVNASANMYGIHVRRTDNLGVTGQISPTLFNPGALIRVF